MRTHGFGGKPELKEKGEGQKEKGRPAPESAPTRTLPALPLFPFSLFLFPFLALGGCSSEPKLTAAYAELNSPRPNYVAVAAAADDYLATEPEGPEAADALYLRGRALEQKAQADATSPQRDFAEAYGFYQQALGRSPRPALEGLIRAGMGNVLYFQDRYAQAVEQLTASAEKLQHGDDRAWVLYRAGVSYQRLGRFDEADRLFGSVEQQFPGSEQARRAAEHRGFKQFWVQVGRFTAPALADAALADLKRQNVPAQKFVDTSARAPQPQYVRAGPLPTYAAAVAMKQRLAATYRDALIVP